MMEKQVVIAVMVTMGQILMVIVMVLPSLMVMVIVRQTEMILKISLVKVMVHFYDTNGVGNGDSKSKFNSSSVGYANVNGDRMTVIAMAIVIVTVVRDILHTNKEEKSYSTLPQSRHTKSFDTPSKNHCSE